MKRRSLLQLFFAFFIAAFLRVFGFSKSESQWEKPPLKSAEDIDWGQQYIGVFPHQKYTTYKDWEKYIERIKEAGVHGTRELLQMRTQSLGISGGPDHEDIKKFWKIWESIT